MKILLVEDNATLAAQLSDALKLQQYHVDIAKDGQLGLEMALTDIYDLLMLDVSLPELDGISLCQRLRGQGISTPVLMMTARGEIRDKVVGLDAGADDYLVKPINLDELYARIRVLQRRSFSVDTPSLQWGKLLLDPETHTVVYDNIALPLTPKEYQLIEVFLKHPRRVHSKSRLLEQVWTYEADLPGEDTIKAHIKGLRRKLTVSGATDLIETVYGVGYRLNPALEV
jgi:DNA-binding response OmpR family regulator